MNRPTTRPADSTPRPTPDPPPATRLGLRSHEAAYRLLFRPQECANSLGVSLRTVMSLVAENAIPYVRLGERNLRFPVDALRDWLAQRTTWPTALTSVGSAPSGETAGDPGAGGPRHANGAAGVAPGQQPSAAEGLTEAAS
jgi:excisionase family DNA binding protein